MVVSTENVNPTYADPGTYCETAGYMRSQVLVYDASDPCWCSPPCQYVNQGVLRVR